MGSSKYNTHLFPDGATVRLKPLEVVMKQEGVTDRNKIRSPYVTSDMVSLFGKEVIVDNPEKPSKYGYFRARGPERYTTYFYSPDWVENNFEIGALPDELFEI